ncbi:4Fe-4S cluster-binding domain-containing protein [Duncaniella dubosii]|uniref:4Fe-4S cluster-binding domain-containing protein n=1 Tax=Duncaniella dubosii TaxID=2518971 RepID=UPI003F6650ED
MEHPDMNRLLDYVDVLVDGPFVETLRDVHLLCRGSSNQRLVDVKKKHSRFGCRMEW